MMPRVDRHRAQEQIHGCNAMYVTNRDGIPQRVLPGPAEVVTTGTHAAVIVVAQVQPNTNQHGPIPALRKPRAGQLSRGTLSPMLAYHGTSAFLSSFFISMLSRLPSPPPTAWLLVHARTPTPTIGLARQFADLSSPGRPYYLLSLPFFRLLEGLTNATHRRH